MATRQYIGARYVPKFYQNSVDGSTQWESNVVYDPLIYVTLQNGHMYISKKQVPATVGTPASNIDYWLDVGSYDGYIEKLQQQINDMNDGTVSGSLQNQIDVMNDGTVTGSLQNQIDTLDNAVDDLSASKKLVFITDSFGTFGSDPWMSEIAAALNLELVAASHSRTGFVASDLGENFLTLLESVKTTQNVEMVIALGGVNDITLSGVSTACTTFITNAKTYFPNAQIIIIGPQYTTTYAAGSTNAPAMVIIDELQYSCAAAGVSYINMRKWFLDSVYTTEQLMADATHPTALGFDVIRSNILSAINGEVNNASRKFGVADVTSSPFSTNNIYCDVINGIFIFNASFTRTGSNLAAGTYTDFALINGSCMNSASYLGQHAFPAFVWETGQCVGYFKIGKLTSPSVRMTVSLVLHDTIVAGQHIMCSGVSGVDMPYVGPAS